MAKNWKWQQEIARMTLYILFPVGTFYLFNQPEFYEDWVTKARQKHLPSDEYANKVREEFRQAARDRDLRLLQEELDRSKKS